VPRSYCVTLVAIVFFISQVVTGIINDIAYLWIASALLGLAYGSVFSLFATVCLEWFGMRKYGLLFSFQILNAILPAHFSENFGYLLLSPIVAGNIFSILFGRNLDAHRSSPAHDTLFKPPPIHVYSPPQCLLGLNCYRDTIYITMFATFLAILLSIWAGYRGRVKMATLRKSKFGGTTSEVIWQDNLNSGRDAEQ
jgi:MFS family permease